MGHKFHRPVKSIRAAEILAASDAIEDGEVLKRLLCTILGSLINFSVALYSRDLFTLHSTQLNSINKSIRGDVNCIRYELEVMNVNEIV